MSQSEITEIIRRLDIISKQQEEIVDKQKDLEKTQGAILVQVTEMYSFYLNGSIGVKIAKWTFAFLMAIGAGYLMVKSIIKA